MIDTHIMPVHVQCGVRTEEMMMWIASARIRNVACYRFGVITLESPASRPLRQVDFGSSVASKRGRCLVNGMDVLEGPKRPG